MKISPSIIRIKKIEPPPLPLKFDEIQIDKAARLILKMGGTITPLILQRTEPEQEAYTIIDGHFEYYAALQAMAIDARKGKTLNAYIVEAEDEVPFYQQQIEMFRQRNLESTLEPLPLSSSQEPELIAKMPSDSNNDDAVAKEVGPLTVLETAVNQLVIKNEALEKTISQLVKENGNVLHNTVEVIKGFLGEEFLKLELQQITHGCESQISQLNHEVTTLKTFLHEKLGDSRPLPPPPPPPEPFLQDINSLSFQDLQQKLKKIRISQKIRDNILQEREKYLFRSIDDMVERVGGLGQKTMVKIRQQW